VYERKPNSGFATRGGTFIGLIAGRAFFNNLRKDKRRPCSEKHSDSALSEKGSERKTGRNLGLVPHRGIEMTLIPKGRAGTS